MKVRSDRRQAAARRLGHDMEIHLGVELQAVIIRADPAGRQCRWQRIRGGRRRHLRGKQKL